MAFMGRAKGKQKALRAYPDGFKSGVQQGKTGVRRPVALIVMTAAEMTSQDGNAFGALGKGTQNNILGDGPGAFHRDDPKTRIKGDSVPARPLGAQHGAPAAGEKQNRGAGGRFSMARMNYSILGVLHDITSTLL
jgi:hypothetical protein